MRERFEYASAWILLKFLGCLPRRVARAIGVLVAKALFSIRPPLQRAAEFNLRLAFPELPECARREILKGMVRNLGWMAAEFARLPRYTRGNIEKAVILDGLENFAAAERAGKGVLFLTGHMGAWELAPFTHALHSGPIHFFVRPIDNSRVDALVNRYRCASGNQPIKKNESARAALRILHDGGVIGVLADQNTVPAEAVFADFFGIPAATSSGIARLARRTGAAVVPAYTYWDPHIGKYRLRYEPALELGVTNDEQSDIRNYSVRFNQVIEDYVRRFPDQWVWVHRRWKTRPANESAIYPDEQRELAKPARGNSRS
jgi:Kdo2-lipid IVA lauroyltransferase/acyltransferase